MSIHGFFILQPMAFICFNGQFLPADQPVFTINNRSFKWGDGVFETMKVYKNQIQLSQYHFDRLFTSIGLLQIPYGFDQQEIESAIHSLVLQNKCAGAARVRLTVYRNAADGADYCIEAVALDSHMLTWSIKGFAIGIYPFTRKACDVFSNLKTANYLPYIMAGRYAKEKGWDECLILNSYNHICDASKANIFLIQGNEIITPALHQGCINGVMRRFVIEEVKKLGFQLKQEEVPESLLQQADEIFLTNAIHGIRWVSTYNNKRYNCFKTQNIYTALFTAKTL